MPAHEYDNPQRAIIDPCQKDVQRRPIDTCCICLADIDEGDATTGCRSQCGHSFHRDCLKQHQDHHHKNAAGGLRCPYCRASWDHKPCACGASVAWERAFWSFVHFLKAILVAVWRTPGLRLACRFIAALIIRLLDFWLLREILRIINDAHNIKFDLNFSLLGPVHIYTASLLCIVCTLFEFALSLSVYVATGLLDPDTGSMRMMYLTTMSFGWHLVVLYFEGLYGSTVYPAFFLPLQLAHLATYLTLATMLLRTVEF